MKHLPTEEMEALCQAVLSLQTPEECSRFLEDVCTIKELHAICQRLAVARLLSAGNNYQEVSQQTGASSATICRVNKCLVYGDGGYRTVLERLQEEAEKHE